MKETITYVTGLLQVGVGKNAIKTDGENMFAFVLTKGNKCATMWSTDKIILV